MNQLTKISLAWELFEEGTPKKHIAQNLGVNRETVHLWLSGIGSHKNGLLGFLDDYANSKKGERAKRKLDGLLKNQIWRIRDKNRDCCGQKVREYLYRESGISLSVKTIYKVLGEKYELRSKWKKNKLRGPVSIAHHAREVIQMDTVDFGDIFAFTGIDIFSKETDVLLRPSLTSHDGLVFLETAMERRFGGYSDLIQADGGPEFKDEFKNNVLRFAKRYRVARPYRKNEQSYIESFNRSFRKECLGWAKYKPVQLPELTQEVNNYLNWYHQRRPHLGLNMKPPLQINQVPDF